MEQPPTDKHEKLETFQKEIFELKHQEEKTKKSVYFLDCNPFELNETDRNIYEKLLSNTLNDEDIFLYKINLEKSGNDSQKAFYHYIANKLTINLLKKEKNKS